MTEMVVKQSTVKPGTYTVELDENWRDDIGHLGSRVCDRIWSIEYKGWQDLYRASLATDGQLMVNLNASGRETVSDLVKEAIVEAVAILIMKELAP